MGYFTKYFTVVNLKKNCFRNLQKARYKSSTLSSLLFSSLLFSSLLFLHNSASLLSLLNSSFLLLFTLFFFLHSSPFYFFFIPFSSSSCSKKDRGFKKFAICELLQDINLRIFARYHSLLTLYTCVWSGFEISNFFTFYSTYKSTLH